ncbi:MAG: hypothetical protein RL026_39 [Pseudomonadota bacterium]|jgi:hypothetical protein
MMPTALRMTALTLTCVLATGSLAAQGLERSASPPGAKAYIVSPADGATVKGPSVKVVFGLQGMGVAPAGIKFENAGHHHLLVNTEVPKDLSLPLPATAELIHFGKGQTETTLTLKPGRHTLQLVLGDHLHIPFNPLVASEKITITVTQ